MSSEYNTLLDEKTRRYYLDAMGIQCWQTVDSSVQNIEDSVEVNKDVVEAGEVRQDGSQLVRSQLDWPQLEQAVKQCSQCALHQTRKQALAGRGNQSADLMIVLLSPSASDDAENTICGGEANILLSKMLAAIDIDIEDVYITSLLKCYVPQKRTASASEMQSCQHYLNQQIRLIQPRIILLLGETTAQCLLQDKLSIDDFRTMNVSDDRQQKKLLYQATNTPLFVSYSPEELLLRSENKRKAWTDLQQLKKIMTTT